MIHNWLITYLFPLFVDTTLLSAEQLQFIAFCFALLTLYIASYMLVWLPFKWFRKLMGDKRK